MKDNKRLIALLFVTGILLLTFGFNQSQTALLTAITGAWKLERGSIKQVLVFQDGYFSQTVFDKSNKKFISSWGGIYKIESNSVKLLSEFDTRSTGEIGKERSFAYVVDADKLTTNVNGAKESWTRIDDGKDNLSGVWRITGRMVDGKLNEMPRRDRKTLKLLSSTRFQWMAINAATKEFFGTGGGRYTFINGKYTEHIEFFSRDSSRVGSSLTFDGSVKDDVWNHSGKSSRGEPMNEIWTKEKY